MWRLQMQYTYTSKILELKNMRDHLQDGTHVCPTNPNLLSNFIAQLLCHLSLTICHLLHANLQMKLGAMLLGDNLGVR